MSDPNDYTVGWICALSTEYVAAQAFLDEVHKPPRSLTCNDDNDYALGKIGEHNVVIAVLPDGEYGISSAGTVARDMMHSFPNVRVGLMVGIGGGAPNPSNDVRLGDVVVSTSNGGKPAVFQCDYGKDIQDQPFLTTGLLEQPPKILRTAVNGLKASYEMDGHKIKSAIENILKKKPRLEKKYRRPSSESDRLYKPEAVHPSDAHNGENDCAVTCGSNSSKVILRSPRTEDQDDPTIHYGPIASSNRLMKNAVVRDKLAAENKVLCFEMEAAGLMNHFPCLVIRGICDYSDSHKNKRWQGYAAMTAAAYAKDLLYRISPTHVEAQKKINEILSDVQEGVEILVQEQRRQIHDAVLDWITPVNYGPIQSAFFERRRPGTCQWFLDSPKFETWVREPGSTLYCPGIPGAGKTILTSVVVENLWKRFARSSNVGIAFIYCNHQRHQDQKLNDLLKALLKQLAEGRPSVPSAVKDLFEIHQHKRTSPSYDEISGALRSVVALYSRAFILIDALDECQTEDDCRTRLISTISGLQRQTNLNFFTTSRTNDEISSIFEGKSSLKINATARDIEIYINEQLTSLPSDIFNASLCKMIKAKILDKFDGMFLLVQLHMNTLRSKTSEGEVEEALYDLSEGQKGLDRTYDDAINRIENQAPNLTQLAKQALCWVVHAQRPLSIVELRHALAVRPDTSELNEKYLPSVRKLRSVTEGLLDIDEKSNIIRLVHYTAQEYFMRNRTQLFPDGVTILARVCLTYLSFDEFKTGFCTTDDLFEERLRLHPLYDYAACNWHHHLKTSLTIPKNVIPKFLEDVGQLSSASQARMVSSERHWSGHSQNFRKQETGLHIAGLFGLRWILSSLLAKGYQADCQDDLCQTPLHKAAANGHFKVFKLLVELPDVIADSRDRWGYTPLSQAAGSGHLEVVRLLVERDDVDADSRDEDGWTPLSQAAGFGHLEVVRLLVERDDVDADSRDDNGQTPLSLAAESGHLEVVRLLVERDDVNADSRNRAGRTPLSYAAKSGYLEIARLLVKQSDVEIDSRDNKGHTPLWWAREGGFEEVIKLLESYQPPCISTAEEEVRQHKPL